MPRSSRVKPARSRSWPRAISPDPAAKRLASVRSELERRAIPPPSAAGRSNSNAPSTARAPPPSDQRVPEIRPPVSAAPCQSPREPPPKRIAQGRAALRDRIRMAPPSAPGPNEAERLPLSTVSDSICAAGSEARSTAPVSGSFSGAPSNNTSTWSAELPRMLTCVGPVGPRRSTTSPPRPCSSSAAVRAPLLSISLRAIVMTPGAGVLSRAAAA